VPTRRIDDVEDVAGGRESQIRRLEKRETDLTEIVGMD
jgi:hypothetical protein